MITDEEIEKALHYLTYEAPNLLRDAKAEAVRSKEYLKVLLSQLFLAHDEGTIVERESAARSAPAYKTAVENYAMAVGELSQLEAYMSAASLKIDVWRSMSANNRGRL